MVVKFNCAPINNASRSPCNMDVRCGMFLLKYILWYRINHNNLVLTCGQFEFCKESIFKVSQCVLREIQNNIPFNLVRSQFSIGQSWMFINPSVNEKKLRCTKLQISYQVQQFRTRKVTRKPISIPTSVVVPVLATAGAVATHTLRIDLLRHTAPMTSSFSLSAISPLVNCITL